MSKIFNLNAQGRPLGRLAVEAALILRGKNSPDFAPYKDSGNFVVIENSAQVKITGKKLQQEVYHHFSGYVGGLKEISMKSVFEKNPGDVIRRAVLGMLPKNKLRAKMIKRLSFK